MTSPIDVPKTVGEFKALLSKYSDECSLSLFKIETYDDGSKWESEAYQMKLEEHSCNGIIDDIEITI